MSSLLDFSSHALWLNALLFAIAAAMVWVIGSHVATYADQISDRTGMGHAFMGLFLLSFATGTPELSTIATSILDGNAPLAVNNIFGGITMQVAILAVVDLAVIGGGLTFFTPRPVLLLEGVLLTVLLGLTLAGGASGEFLAFHNVGLWATLLLVGQVGSLYLVKQYEGRERWHPSNKAEVAQIEEKREDRTAEARREVDKRYKEWSLGRFIFFFALGTLGILALGVILARTSAALAEQTGLGQSFVGATLLAGSTTLPELSTTIRAARLGNYSMAISNVFGSNANMVLQLWVADLFLRDGLILDTVGKPALFSAAMGIVLTAIYLVGLIERNNRTFLRMGLDSVAVFILYGLSLGVLYQLR